MIQPNELRKENIVSLELGGGFKHHLVRVKEILHDHIMYEQFADMPLNLPPDEWQKCMYCYVKPLPLTEELLIKSDFKENSNTSYEYKYVKNKVAIHVKGGKFYLIYDLDHEDVVVEIEYVHQLQNFIFVLTGE